MSLDSDVNNADALLHVEFFEFTREPYKGQPFVRIMVPGDKLNIVEQPLNDAHKRRFPRQFLAFQMDQQGEDPGQIGTPLKQWHIDRPEEFNDVQLAEMQILKFQTVEQIALASDIALQRVGMGASGMRTRAQAYLKGLRAEDLDAEKVAMRAELDELRAMMAEVIAARSAPAMLNADGEPVKRGPGRPPKVTSDVQHHAATGDASHQ